MKQHNALCAALLAAWFSCLLSMNSFAQLDPTFLTKHSVRVVARGVGKPKASSGFLWQNANQVVTALHGVPKGTQITVECRGAKQAAKVIRALPSADLALLETSGLPASCQPFTRFDANKPKPGTTLWTFGYYSGAPGGTSRKFEKGLGVPEQIQSLVTGKPLKEIMAIGMPAVDLDIYYVQGGLLPGYSGGPVVNASGTLVGIVDGGLDKGASDYNWVIPAKYLQTLADQGSSEVPDSVAAAAAHFSAGIADDAQAVFTYVDENTNVDYQWVKTKTKSLFELGQTADDAEGVGHLLDVFAAAAGVTSAEQLRFDIYEDQFRGLVIAVPEGQGLSYSDTEDGMWLTSKNSNGSAGFNGIRFAHADWEVSNARDQIVPPSDPNYFNDFVTELLIDCHTPGETYCTLDEQTVRIIDFGGGNKLLKLGMTSFDYGTQNPLLYDYYSFAVRGDEPFGAQARINPEGNSGLFQCLTMNNAEACTDTTAAQQQLAQLIAVHLTTFAGLESQSDYRIVETQYRYDASADNPATIRVPYYENGELRLYNTRGIQWKLYLPDGEVDTLFEYTRDEPGYINLQWGEQYLLVPEAGGEYYSGEAGGDWVSRGILTR